MRWTTAIKWKIVILPLLVLAVTLASCGAGEVGLETDEGSVHTTDEASSVVTLEPGPTTTEMEPKIEPAHPASGLTFSNAEGTWWIDAQGKIQLLIDQTWAWLSPDAERIVYEVEEVETGRHDIWLLELTSGVQRNLTNTPDRDEVGPSWWLGRPGVVVFGSDTRTYMENAEFPTIVGLDGSGYRILDTNRSGPRALSLDGQAIAYGGYDKDGVIYRWDVGPEPFDPAEYGILVEKLFQPAWSPDGRYLAWKVAGDFWGNGSTQIGVAIFDLEAQTANLYHVYQPVGGGMFANYLEWSHDGQWLAFVTHNEDAASGRQPNLWVLRPQDGLEIKISPGDVPTWRYDGRYLAYMQTDEEGHQEVWLAEADTWESAEIIDLPLQEMRILLLRGWVRP
jgi:Tol biopolymer transport system component